MDPNDPRHGLRAGYIAGCHEQCCLTPHSRYQKRSRLRLQREGTQIVPAYPALDRIAWWSRYGVSLNAINRAAGVGDGTLRELVSGERDVCLKSTVRAVLAVTWNHLPDNAHVNSGITVARINSLMAAGHPLTWICEVTPGLAHSGRWRRQSKVTIGLARAVMATYETAPLSGPSKITLTKARNRGSLHPLAWEDPGLPAMPADWTPVPEARSATTRKRSSVAETLEDFDWLVSQGVSEEQAARQIGKALSTVEKYRMEMKGRAA